MSLSVTLHGGPAGGFTRAGQAMTSCRLQSNYISTVTLHGGPVVLHPVRATPCFVVLDCCLSSQVVQSCFIGGHFSQTQMFRISVAHFCSLDALSITQPPMF